MSDVWLYNGQNGQLFSVDSEAWASVYAGNESYQNDIYFFADLTVPLEDDQPTNELFFYHDADTMDKVYSALKLVGLDEAMVIEAVNEMQNNGILFRELKRESDI